MGKVLLWIVVILGVMMIARLLSQHNARERAQATRPKNLKSRPGGAKPVESMVRCAHCGIHLPRSEALLSQGQTWCSAEHAKLGVRPQA